MSQSALIAAALFAMFLVFVAINDRFPVYTNILWGGGGKGGGTVAPKGEKTVLDPEGDGFGEDDAAKLISALLPYPFDVPFDLLENT